MGKKNTLKNFWVRLESEVLDEHNEETIGKTNFRDYLDYIHYT